MAGIYGMWEGPRFTPANPDELMQSAVDQPLGMGATLLETGKQGFLDSIFGSAVRDLGTPEGGELPETGSTYADTVQALDDVIAPRSVVKRLLGTLDRTQPAMTEDAYKNSAWFREGVPWDTGMTEERAEALAQSYDIRKAREFYAQKRPITAFFGALGGQALDPVNYIPFAGPAVKSAAVAKAGRLGGAVATGAVDAALNTAVFGGLAAGMRNRLGDEITWESTVSEIATAALIGGAFGAMARGWEARVERRLEERMATLRNTQQARVALNEAISGVALDGDVRLGPNSVGPIARVAREMDEVGRAYDQVLASPRGPVDDPLVRITPEQIESTIMARGAFKDINEVEFSERGYGLVKIAWQHGEKSNLPPEFQVGRDDVVAFPEVIREYAPSKTNSEGTRREWRVERGGRTIVYADKVMKGDRHVVTAYVQEPTRKGFDAPLSERISTSRSVSPDVSTTQADTAGGLSADLPRVAGRPDNNIGRSVAVDNSPPRSEPLPDGISEAAARAAKAEDLAVLKEQYRVDPETGDFPELADIENLRAQGRLTEDEIADLEATKEALDDANAYGEALKSVVGCML